MSDKNVYGKLIEHAGNWILGIPDSDLLMQIFQLRFTPEEAEFLSGFPHRPHTIEELAEKYKIPADGLLEIMEPMLRKGLIYRVEGRSAVRYSFPDPLFFFYRMPGWKGEEDEFNRRISPMINRYYRDHMGADFMGHPTMGLRAIPVARTVEDTHQILPYEDILEYVDREEYHSVSICPCRHRHNLDPDFESCEHETLNCLHFGRLGRYIVKHDMGKEISSEETLEILAAAADAGLVHGISNTRTGMDTICNCCSCCCLFLEELRTDVPVFRGHQRSNYRLEINHDTCKRCGLCAKRCPVDALELREREDVPESEAGAELNPKDRKEIVYNTDACIGCGVCAHTCPTQSLKLVRREGEEDIPENMSEAGLRMLRERNRDLSKVW